MKKICFITTISSTITSFVLPTANMLCDNGYDVTLICNGDEQFEKSLPQNIKYIPLEMKRGISLELFKRVIELKKIFEKQKFDVVQYATPNASLYASIAAKLARIPVRLYCQWGIRYVGFTGIKRKIFKVIEKFVCIQSTDVRSPSKKNLEFAVEERLYKVEKVKVLGEGGTIGIELEEYDIENKEGYRTEIREQYKLQDDFVFGFVGRFSVDKGCNELLKAFQKLTRECNCTLLCIGRIESEKGVDEKLYSWAQNCDKIIFTGPKENRELKKYYATMDCYVHPTYREGFGMVLQEAAAMGCPIITTDIPGASEVMEQNVSCLLAQPRDVESLYCRMKEIMSDEVKSKKMGRAARKRVETYFKREIMLGNQKKDYADLLR